MITLLKKDNVRSKARQKTWVLVVKVSHRHWGSFLLVVTATGIPGAQKKGVFMKQAKFQSLNPVSKQKILRASVILLLK